MSKVKVFFQHTAFLAVLLLSACSDFHAPVADYLDEYANRAAIGSQAISVPTERDIDGIECVASETSVTITFFLRNPRSYTINPVLTFNNPGLSQSQGFISQSPDHQSIILTFLQSYLADNDRGTDFSGTISLSEAATGRPFPSWNYSLRCNTPPPRPKGARVMLDLDTNTYVLCFNLDLSNPVHDDDIAVVRINSTDYYPTAVQAGGTREITFGNNPEFSPTPPGTLVNIPNQPAFVENGTPVYFSTGITQSGATQNFTITIRDPMGLSRTASTSTAGNMLAPVTVTDSDGNAPTAGTLTLSPHTNDNYQVRLSHTDNAATIHYTFGGTTYTVSGSFPQTIEVTESGTLEVWATRTGYVSSDRVTVNLVCQNNQYYVDPDGGNNANPGTRTRPFKTIEYALGQFPDPTDSTNTIFLLGNVTPLNRGGSTGIVDIVPTEDITVIIDGVEVSGKATITGEIVMRCIYVDATSHTVNLTLQNLTLTGGKIATTGGGISFQAADNGSSLSLDYCVVESNQASTGGGIYFTGSELNIDNSRIRNNTMETTYSANGAGIYMAGTGTSATANISSTEETTEISGNTGKITGMSCMGGGIYASNINLIISGGTISGNTANSEYSGMGGGIYQASGTLTIQSGTIISGNWGTKAASTGQGGGIAFYGTTLEINGAEIFGNYASTQGSGWGGGIYVKSTTTSPTTVKLTDVDINTNWGSTGSTGYGGGIHAERTTAGLTNITLTGGSIHENTASNLTGLGGGISLVTNDTAATVLLHSPVGSNVQITGNKATTSGSSVGYGGGIFVRQGGQVVWESGTISGNQANSSGTSDITKSQGEGIYILGGSGYTTQFTFTDGSIAEGVSTGTGNVVYLNHYTQFLFEGDTAITDGNIYLDSGTGTPPVIRPTGLLTAPVVAHLVPNDYGRTEPILDLNTAINYYKFTVQTDTGTSPNTRYCINADGKLSRIVPYTASTTANITTYLASAPIDGRTLEITLNTISNTNSTFTIPTNAHVRIIPNSDLSHNANAQLFIIMNGGHLLFGDPAQNIKIDLQYSDRQQHLFDLIASGSLVLRNVTVKNAQQLNLGSLSNAALVASGNTTGTSTVVLEDFIYHEDVPVSQYQSTRSALQLQDGSDYHFVSGSITGFDVWEPSYGGVANIDGTGKLYIDTAHCIFSGNQQYNGNSVSGNLSGLHPTGLVLY